jgi:ankyrin repeat protein
MSRYRRPHALAIVVIACFIAETAVAGEKEAHLIRAVRSDDLAAVEECITSGADVNTCDEEGLTPLIWSASGAYRAIVARLLSAGADVNGRGALGATPLNGATRAGKADMVKMLLERGADVNARNESGWSALFFAAVTGSTEIIETLLSRGADVHARDLYGSTPLLVAADLGREGALKVLVEAGANINAQDRQGATALILASYRGYDGIVKFLLQRGADVNLNDVRGHTPLMFASMIGFEEIVRLLLSSGSRASTVSKDGQTAFSLALKRGHAVIARILRKARASSLGGQRPDQRNWRQARSAAMGSHQRVQPTPQPDVTVAMRASKITQLVGEFDRQQSQLTRNRTLSRYKLVTTDLGVPFRHKNRIYLLFGDTSGVKGGDAIAYTSIDAHPENGIDLTFLHDKRGVYEPVRIPGISQGNFEVPVEGVSVGGNMYVYHTTDHSRKAEMGRSVVAVSRDDGTSFRYLYDLSTKYFINVSVVKVRSFLWKGLPVSTREGLVMFGSGSYRKSPVRLAFQPASGIEQPDSIRYFSGLDSWGIPMWSTREEDAVPLFDQACVGELSVSYNRFIRKWIMLYNCQAALAGVLVRTSDYPWGPWSEPQVLFDANENGYCRFLHRSWAEKKCDILSDPGRQDQSGDTYGPYQFKDLAVGEGTRTTIYFTLSTWNPYTVVLMKATLQRAEASGPTGHELVLTQGSDETGEASGRGLAQSTIHCCNH